MLLALSSVESCARLPSLPSMTQSFEGGVFIVRSPDRCLLTSGVFPESSTSIAVDSIPIRWDESEGAMRVCCILFELRAIISLSSSIILSGRFLLGRFDLLP